MFDVVVVVVQVLEIRLSKNKKKRIEPDLEMTNGLYSFEGSRSVSIADT